jgi:hypothetical protein
VTAALTGARDLIIVSGADSGYFPLLRDTVLSVRSASTDVAMGVLDLGLSVSERDWLSALNIDIVVPDWDVAFPRRDRMPIAYKAQVARPFLPRHFPGYAIYLWLDADTWLQDWRAVELYCAAAQRGRLAITVEIDRSYKRHYKRPKLFGTTLAWKCYRDSFGWRVADRLGRNPMVNVGAFALRADAPHWGAWARVMSQALQRRQSFFVEQISLSYLVFSEHLPTDFLPCYCNWMVGDAAPAFDSARGLFVEPYSPHEVIGVMHLAGREQKDRVFRLDTLDGGTVATSLRYSETRSLCA